ncbi:MAG: glycosyltransferase family 2 protein [Clostridia bacterium]|nr:glycosyltransferase family 2 protein [Clostridia bacterium]
MQTPEISVIVPAYRAENYIKDCAESVLGQTFADFELILVDDGSPDGCGRIIDEIAQKDARVKAVHKENGGPVSARKAGISAASGRYVMNLDSDDTLEKDTLSEVHKYISESNSDVYCFGFYFVTGDKKELILPNFDEGLYDTPEKMQIILNSFIYDAKKPFYTFGIYPSIWSKVVKRELYTPCQNAINDSLIIGEDFALSFLIFHRAKSVFIIKKPYYDYKYLPFSLSRNISADNWETKAEILREFEASSLYKKEETIIKPQLGAYLTEMLYNYLYVTAKEAEKYGDYAGVVKNLDGIIRKYVNFCKYNFHSLRGIVVVFLIKHNMKRSLWLMAKIRPYRIKLFGNK